MTVVLEIGRCGFESSRLIQSLGADVHIVPMNKLTISSKSKRAKSDRLDAEFLSRLNLEETPRVWIPSSKQSSRRKLLECRENKQKEINRINLRLQSFIAYAPFRLSSLDKKMPFPQWRETLNTWKQQVPDLFDLVLWEEMFDLLDRLELAEKSYKRTMDRIEAQEGIDRQKCQEENIEHIVDKIRKIKGFGVHSSRVFAWYIGDFTRFSNGKKFSSYLGLTPTPYSSCKTRKEMGISKSGKPILRQMAVQIAWLWRRYQPDTWLVKKWEAQLKNKRSRKTSIIAMARQLMVALYRFIVHDEIIEGMIVE